MCHDVASQMDFEGVLLERVLFGVASKGQRRAAKEEKGWRGCARPRALHRLQTAQCRCPVPSATPASGKPQSGSLPGSLRLSTMQSAAALLLCLAVPAGASDIVTYDDMSYSDGIQVSTNSQTAPAAACKPPRAQPPSPSPANTAGSAGDGRVLRAVVRALQEPGSGVRTGRNRAGR